MALEKYPLNDTWRVTWLLHSGYSGKRSIKISLKFIPKDPINSKSALVQVMTWHRTGDKQLSETMLTQLAEAYMRH